jgi:hypothetical protein
MTTWTEIETAARKYADARRDLGERLHALDEDVAAAKKRHLKAVRSLAEAAAEEKGRLSDLVAGAPELFDKPRTRLLHGVKFGFVKARGKLEWADPAQVIRLIRKFIPDQAEALIKVSETPLKTAIARLDGATLKKLGVSVIETGDVVVVETTDSEIDKLVDALLKEPVTAEAQEHAA